MTNEERLKSILNYHDETKHSFNRYARSLGYMDWENQPNPFRIYKGCESSQLMFQENFKPKPHKNLFFKGDNPVQPFSLESISEMIEYSMALSAWKRTEQSKWSLRINPSSGNLHPTESYWLLPNLDKLDAGLYHYNSLMHNLTLRNSYDKDHSNSWKKHYGSEGFFVALSSIFWRESWKYGERAFRYCNHDIGHAISALSFSANLLGWSLHYIDTTDEELSTILGLDKTTWHADEKEEPDVLFWVSANDQTIRTCYCPPELLEVSKADTFEGAPNQLSSVHHPWEIIDNVALACHKTEHDLVHFKLPDFSPLVLPESAKHAQQVIKERRSAVNFSQDCSMISYEHFKGILSSTLPRENVAPFNCKPNEPRINLLLFVHDVTDLDPGLYILLRSIEDLETLKKLANENFLWKKVDNDLPLYLLERKNYRREAQLVSCQQAIAGESAFSLGMLARFEDTLTQYPHLYKHLYWETGMIGQVLYLQAEAYGLRGTGIGCFFDDVVHSIFGLEDHSYQSLYHFTIGFPVEDDRLSTLPAYHHLPKQ